MTDPVKRTFLQEYGSLVLILAVVLLLGVVCQYGATSRERGVLRNEMALAKHVLESKEPDERVATELAGALQRLHEGEFRAAVLRHVSIAFYISFIIILAVELHTRRLTRKDLDEHLESVKLNVWAAIGKRLLGEQIAKELEAIMKETAAKVDCKYVITFKRPGNELSNDRDHVIVEIMNTFKLRTLSDEKKDDRVFRFRSTVSGYEELGDLPRYTLFKAGDKREDNPVTDREDKTRLSRNVELPEAPEDIEVTVGFEIPYKLRDSEAFITEVPIEGLTVWVKNLVPDLIGDVGVDMIHRCSDTENPIAGIWTFDRAILPGQGFFISWKETTKQLPAHLSDQSALRNESKLTNADH